MILMISDYDLRLWLMITITRAEFVMIAPVCCNRQAAIQSD